MQVDPFETIAFRAIGVIRSCFREKFGIPRQSGLAPSAGATIELIGDYNREEVVRGLDCYSHVWIQFLFHRAVAEGWKATVRPPRLGGRERLGVFATRSPHRPNHLGLSVVKLVAVRVVSGDVKIDVSGIDLLDGTPVIDLKPYVPYSDCVEAAEMKITWEERPTVRIGFSPQAEQFCMTYRMETGRDLKRLICEILQQDPRPASQKGSKSEYGMSIWDINVRWGVGNNGYTVISCGADIY